MAWPFREDLWRDLDAARRAYADVARAIRRFEPVTMVAHPDHTASAAGYCGSEIDVVPIAIDDSWTRDSGPTFLVDGRGGLGGTSWRFNAWGNKHRPWFNDARLGDRILHQTGAPAFRSPLVFEGGALHVDGEGTVITTETVVFNDNRNPGITRDEAEQEICHALGVEKVVWLPGDPDEYETNGHMDGIACFVRPGVVLYETNPDDSDPHSKTLKENLAALERATDARGRSFELIPIEEAHDVEGEGDIFCRSYVNFYIANGGVVAPAYGTAADERVRELLSGLYPGRELSLVDISAIAPGGGGIHCITQQQPAV
jgi:agmatine deiminase